MPSRCTTVKKNCKSRNPRRRPIRFPIDRVSRHRRSSIGKIRQAIPLGSRGTSDFDAMAETGAATGHSRSDNLPQVQASPCTHRVSHRCGHRQRVGARLSNPAGAHRRPVYSERHYRHHSAPDRTLAVGATRSDIHHREPTRSRCQYPYRGVRKSAPDGYTLLLESTSNAINATLYDKLNFDVLTDVVSVAGIMATPLIVLVHPSFPWSNSPVPGRSDGQWT